jgi:hypothetical protein
VIEKKWEIPNHSKHGEKPNKRGPRFMIAQLIQTSSWVDVSLFSWKLSQRSNANENYD